MLLEELPPQLDHPLQILTADVEVGQNARQRAAADQHAAVRASTGRIWPPAPVIGAGTARWSVRRVRRSPRRSAAAVLQPDRVVMVFAQPRDVMLQSVKTGRRQDAGLTQPAAGHLAPAQRALMKASLPHSSDPTGAPNPFDRQMVKVSQYCTISFSGRFSATAALKMRAPSICSASCARG